MFDERIMQFAVTDIVPMTLNIIQKDVSSIIPRREQFASPNPEIGAPLEEVEMLSPSRIKTKKAWGYPFPEIPRLASGTLTNSIRETQDNLLGQVFTDDEAAQVQQEGGGPWRDEFRVEHERTHDRPFFGVSGRALRAIEQMVEGKGRALVERGFDDLRLEPVTIRLTG